MEAIKLIIGNATLSRDEYQNYVIDFGILALNSKAEVYLQYSEDILNSNLQSTCGCATSEGNKIEYLNTHQYGEFVKTIVLTYFAEKENKTEYIKIKGKCQ